MISQVDEDLEVPFCDAHISVLTELRLVVGGCWEPSLVRHLARCVCADQGFPQIAERDGRSAGRNKTATRTGPLTL